MTTIPSPKLTITPDEAAQPVRTASQVVERTVAAVEASKAETIAGVTAAIQEHVAPSAKKRRSGWRSTSTWMVFGQLALGAMGIAKAKDAAVQQAVIIAAAGTVANHGYNSRKLKTTDPTAPKSTSIVSLLNFGGGAKK